MRKFNTLIPVLLGLCFGALSFQGFASTDIRQNINTVNGNESTRNVLSELSTKSTQDFTSLPVSENWDADPAPADWTYFTNSAEGTIEVQSSTYNSADYAVEFSDLNDETSDYILVSPGTAIAAVGTRVKFSAKANSMFPQQMLKVGIMTDPADPASYINLSNVLISNSWEEYIVDMSSTPPQSGTYYIAIKANFDGTGKHIYLDDFVWEETPTGPILNTTPELGEFGMVFFGNSSADIDFTLTNYGIGSLDISDISITGTDAADFVISNTSETLPFSLTGNSANSITVSVNFTPLTTGLKSANLDITDGSGTTSIPLTGESPEGLIQIGEGTVTEAHLPMEPYYGYTYSQSLYLQSEINIADQRISKVYYQKNNQNEWEDAGQITIYMGHTTQTELTGWIDIANLQEVTYSEALPTADEDGWIEFTLATPFIYNNTDNLVIAFNETKPSYDGYNDEFYNHTTSGNTSIYYYEDGNAQDPANPEGSNLSSNRPNIRLLFEDLPSVPVISINPDSWDYETVIVSSYSDKSFAVQNTGIGDLTINNIYLGGTNMDQYSLSALPTFPVTITNDPTEAFDIICSFIPTTDGLTEAKIFFDSNVGLDSITLTGNGYDATIYTLPWDEYFDDPATTTTPNMTLGWNSIINTTSSYAHINTYAYSSFSSPNCIEIYNSGDASTENYLALPPTSIPVNNIKLKAMIKGTSGLDVEAGIMTDNTDVNTFIPVATFTCTGTGSYQQFESYINSAAVTGTYFIAFRVLNTSTYQYAYIDNVELEEVPVEANPILSNNTWDAGQRPVGYTNQSDIFTLSNLGQSNLTITNITDLSTSPFSTTLVPGDVDLALDEHYDFSFEFTPTEIGVFDEEFIIETPVGNDTIFLSGYCEYTLPSDVIEIGWDTATNITPNLPMEPTAAFSYSQTLFKQSEIDVEGQAIHKLFYHQQSSTTQAASVKVYIGHYSGDNLESGWENIGNLVEVFNGVLGAPNPEGWVDITLSNPFVYNNTDNLLIAFDDNSSLTFLSTDGFYQSTEEENLSRILIDNNDNIDPATITGGQLLTHRPNIRFLFGGLPTIPIYNLNLSNWDAGMIPGGMTGTSGDIFKISNTGGGTLTLTDAVLLNGSEFATTLVAGDVSLAAGEEYYFSFTYSPIDNSIDADTLVITHADGTDTIFLAGHADYTLPENMIEIGQGTETNVSLPMEPYYGYSYSQSLFLQSEINMEGMRISKLYYHKNDQDDWTDAGNINIYMGHTTVNEISDWIDITTLQEVKYSEVLPLPDTDGWVEFILTTPFIYNNTDNLVIAFDENKSGYDSSSDEFYNHAVENNMSIRYYNDSNNPDPTNPPSGTAVSYRPNIRLQFEDLPTTPVMTINPEAYDYGTIIVSNSSNTDFLVQNTGINILTINDIYLGGTNMDQFALSNLPTFPADLTNDFADAFSFDAAFNPTTDGALEAKIYIDHSEGLDSVLLTGIGYDATIYAIPYSEFFDDPATTTVPNITLGWNAILNSSSTSATLETEAAAFISEPNSVEFYNSGDNNGDYILVSPPTSLDPAATRIRFFANGSSSHNIQVGYLTDQFDADTFVPVDTVDLNGSYTQFFADFSNATPTGTWYIGFKVNFGSTYTYVNIDNVTWELIPTTPVFEANYSDIDFGEIPMMENAGPETVLVSNVGVGDLIITDVELSGADVAEFSINIIDTLNDTITNVLGDNLTVEASFNPTSEGIKTADILFTDIDLNTYTVALTGTGLDVTMYPDTLVDFNDGSVPPPFWTSAEGMLEETVSFSSTSSGWQSDDFANNTSSTNSARLNIWSTDTKDWLITTPIYLGDGTQPAVLEFDLATTPYSSTSEAGAAPDDRFAVIILPEGETEWSENNALRIYDNTGSEFVYDNIPNGDGEHVEISLGAYTGLVKIALYGESTITNSDNNLFVDNFEVRLMSLEEIALNETIDSTTITPAQDIITYTENVDGERVLDFAVNFPTPFNANLNELLLHDYMIELGTVLPAGVTIDVEVDDFNIGQIVSDEMQTSFWLTELASVARPVLNTMIDENITLKINGLTDIGMYSFTLKSFTALDGEFEDSSLRILLAEGNSTIHVTPTPVTLPFTEDFSEGIPANWIINENGENGAEWTYMTDAAFGSTTGSNGYMRVNDFAAGASAITNTDLITVPIDMSAVTGSVKLEFEHYYNHFTSSSANIFVSVDNGANWTEVATFSSDQASMDTPELLSYDITDIAAGESNVTVRWNFNDGGAQTFEWNIDDIHIYEYAQNSEAEILTFDITGQISSNIYASTTSIDVVMPNGTNLASLIPTFTLSNGASATIGSTDQISGTTAVDFSSSTTAPVVYTVTAENGTTKEWQVIVSTETNIVNTDEFNFAVYPNPNNGQFDLNVYSENGFTYSIYATDGKLLIQESIKDNGSYTENINLKDIAPGFYTIKVKSEDTVKIRKLIIK